MTRALRDAGLEPGDVELGQRARHLDPAQRPLGDRGDQDRPWRPRREGPGLLAEVRDRPPARRRRRRRGGCDRARAARRRCSHPRSAGRSATPGLDLDYVPGERATARGQRPPGRRDLELVRLRRPQRRPVLRGRDERHARDLAPTASVWHPLARLERLCDPGSLRPFRSEVASRAERSQRARRRRAHRGGDASGGRPVFCLLAGPQRPRRVARRVPGRERSCACFAWPATPGAPVVGFVESARRPGRRGRRRRSGGYGRIFSEHVRLRRLGAPDLRDHRHLGRAAGPTPPP